MYEMLRFKGPAKAPCCKMCGAKMYLDDQDYGFKGKYDNYWNCPNCSTSCIEEIRFSQKFKEHWHSENNGHVVEESIKFSINTERA